MCGLAGLLAAGPRPSDAERIVASMTATLAPRGPDGSGTVAAGPCVLGHRRLAIRDAAGGAQPLASADGLVHLVYNGELTNDAELRRSLGPHRFATRCDTETVLAAYLRWGDGFAGRLQGQFAIALFDARDRSLRLLRDRCGIKPLHYATTADGSLAFASTPAALLAHPGVPRRPDLAAISHYLATFRLTLGRRTLFDGIRALQPGERLTIRDGRASLDRFADFPLCPPDEAIADLSEPDDNEERSRELESHLRDAVRRRLVGDSPVGLFLSGGVDSAVLASLLRDEVGSFPAVAIGEAGGEELRAAAATARAVGCDFEPIAVDADGFVDSWEHLLDATRLPLSTPSDGLIFRLAQAMRPRARVALGGEGADELLAGYALPHAAARDYRLLCELDPGPTREAFADTLAQVTGRRTFGSLADHFLHTNTLLPPAAKRGVLHPDVWETIAEDAAMTRHYAMLLAGDDAAERRVYRGLRRVNLDGQLSRLDSATMLAGLEARVPYCDDAVADFAAAQPWRCHLGWAAGAAPRQPAAMQPHAIESKRLLRRVAARLLPPEIAARPKASFPTPAATLLAGPLAGEIQSLLLRSRFARRILSAEAIATWAADPAAAGMALWPVVNLVRWGDREFESTTLPVRRAA